jgi:hypothetical protein
MLRGRFLISAIFAVVIYLFVFRDRLLERVFVQEVVPDLEGTEPYSPPTSGKRLQKQYLAEFNSLQR